MESDLIRKAESLAQKMNKINESLDLSDEMLVDSDDMLEHVRNVNDLVYTNQQSIVSGEIADDDGKVLLQLLKLQTMSDDFTYIRNTLKTQTENVKRVLVSITEDLLSETDESSRASNVLSFAELNKALVNVQSLYLQSYKDMAKIISDMNKVKNETKHITQPSETGTTTVNNHLTINSETMSAMDVIEQLRQTNKD